MKKFKFRLEKILNFRKTEENLKKQAVFEAKRQYEIKKSELERFNYQRLELFKQIKRFLIGIVDLPNLMNSRNFLEFLNKNIKDCEKSVIKLKTELEKKTKELIEAKREVKKLEKLKEKKFNMYKEEIKLQENNFFDDIGQKIGLSRINKGKYE